MPSAVFKDPVSHTVGNRLECNGAQLNPGQALTLREAVARCQTSCLTILTPWISSSLSRNLWRDEQLFLSTAVFFQLFFCLHADWPLGADAGLHTVCHLCNLCIVFLAGHVYRARELGHQLHMNRCMVLILCRGLLLTPQITCPLNALHENIPRRPSEANKQYTSTQRTLGYR